MEDMFIVETKDQMGYILTWKIQNYRMCAIPKNRCISSPKFLVYDADDSEWQIKLYPWNQINQNSLGLRIEKVNDDTDVSFEISIKILTTEGDYSIMHEGGLCFDEDCNSYNYLVNLTHEDIIKDDSIFIINETLTLSCHLMNNDDENLYETLVECSALTQIKIDKRIFHCRFDPINEQSVGQSICRCVPRPSELAPDLNLILDFPTMENNAQATFGIILRNRKKFYTMQAKISVVRTDGNLKYTSKHHMFSATEGRSWNFWPKFSLKQLLDEKELNLYSYGILTLQCEVVLSSSTYAIRSYLEECNYIASSYENKDDESKLRLQRLPDTATLSSSILASCEGLLSLKDDIKNLLNEQKLCDVVIQTQDKTFPVHKAILCARSPVFQSMFESDMKEKESGVVHINDIDAKTMEIFLKYLYTGGLERNLKFETALTLYSTADKNQVKPLKKECGKFLSSKISKQNVCDILILADLHQDCSLKLAAEKVFCEHSKDLLLSEEWRNLILKYPNLVAKISIVIATKMQL